MKKNKFNLLFVADFEFKMGGGVGRVTETLAEHFVSLGYGVVFLSICHGVGYVNENGTSQHFVPDPDKPVSVKNVKFLNDIIENNNINIIINQIAFSLDANDLMRSVKSNNLKLVSVHHNCVKDLYDNYPEIVSNRFKKWNILWLINLKIIQMVLKFYCKKKLKIQFLRLIDQSDSLVLLSDKFVNELPFFIGNKYPKNKVKSIVNPCSFDLPSNSFPKKTNRLLYVGRLEYVQKRCDLLLTLWERISPHVPEWHFDIVGDGPARFELEKRADSENLKRIKFYGFQDPRPFFERSKIFCLTSSFEGFGLVIVEAQAYGTVPVVFNTFSALNDIIKQGVSGVLIDKNNIDQFEYVLRLLMSNDELINSFGKGCKDNVKKYNIESISNEWESLFDNLFKTRLNKSDSTL